MKKLLTSLVKKSYLLLLLFSVTTFSQVTIRSQSFENATSDNLSYTVTSTTNVFVSTGTGVSGSRSLNFRGSNNATFQNVDITGYSNVQVSVSFASLGVDSNEDLFIEFSYDNGNTYQSAIQLVAGNNNKKPSLRHFRCGCKSLYLQRTGRKQQCKISYFLCWCR